MIDFENLSTLTDLWTHLKMSEKPIVLYGMGDGADKILNVCESKGIKISGIFASDEFVKNKIFRGFQIERYSDIKKRLGEIIILVSFATRIPDVMDKIYTLENTDEVYAPDVPVFGEGIFDSSFFAENYSKFKEVYSYLKDDISKNVFTSVIAYKITGRLQYLKNCETAPSESYKNIIRPKDVSVYCDIGAYNGDTLCEYLSFAGNKVTAYCFEPDLKNCAKLQEKVKTLDLLSARVYNIACWDKKEELTFYSRSGRNSAHTSANSSHKAKTVLADRADSYINDKVDFINIDAEGSDLKVLSGLEKVINKDKPCILCAVYHRNSDMFEIPLYLISKYEKPEVFFRHFSYIPAWDTNFYIRESKN